MDDTIPLSENVFYNPAHSSLEMLSGTASIHLTPNEKKLLEIVLENRGRKDTIIEEIWTRQGIVVSESSYHQLVKMLRRKFHEATLQPSALKTIPRYGIVLVNGKKESEIHECDDEALIDHTELVTEVLPRPLSEKSIPSETCEGPEQEWPDAEPLIDRAEHSAVPILMTQCGVWMLIVLAVLAICAPAVWVYIQNDSPLFSHRLIKDNVTYHATSSTYFGKDIMARVAHGLDDLDLDSVTKEVYISGNGPKVWVAYCQNMLEKENAKCAYTHFSAY